MLRIGVTSEILEEHEPRAGEPPESKRDLVGSSYLTGILKALRSLELEAEWVGPAATVLSRGQDIKDSFDFVFNLAEGVSSPSRASAVPLLLELLEVPYLGSDAFVQALSLNKYQVLLLAREVGMPTPESRLVRRRRDLDFDSLPKDTLIVKPVREGSSVGIHERNVSDSPEQVQAVARELMETYRQPVLLQRFVRGFEITVPLVGNDSLDFFQPMSVVMDEDHRLGEKIYSSDIKYLEDDRVKHVPCDLLAAEEIANLRKSCWSLFQLLGIRDYVRMDFRVDDDGNWFLIDVNAIAHLGQESSFARAFRVNGLSYEEMLAFLLRQSFSRWGIQW